jgi:hypothetical protein
MLPMRKSLVFAVLLFLNCSVFAQQHSEEPSISLKWAPTGLAVGSLSLQGEYNFGKNSLTAKIGIPLTTSHTFQFDDKDASFNMRAMSFLAGYRTYLSKKHMRGLYFEPYFKYVHHSSDGTGSTTLEGVPVIMEFNNNYNGIGVGAQLGAQFLIGKHFVIDLFFLGPEINSATNNFKAQEVTTTIPWTVIQKSEAEQNIKDFINKFPFLKNNTTVMVDQNNKTVFADFKGALPGFRIGVSLGVAF